MHSTRSIAAVMAALLVGGGLVTSPIVAAAEPVPEAHAEQSKLAAFKIRWIERRREQNLRDRMLPTERLAPRLQSFANALWRDSSQNGFSLDVDPGDEEVILRYRVRF
jgi:hypothetical protein